MNSNGLILGFTLALLGAGTAAAQPACGGAPLAPGAEVHGPVLHVIDGRTLCVARGADPAEWISVRLDDAPPSSSWGALMSVAFARNVTCASADGAGAGVCKIEGRAIGPQLDSAATQAGVAWKRPLDRERPFAGPTRVATAN